VNTALLSLNNRALFNKSPHNQDDLHTGRQHGLVESARTLRLKIAGIYRRIVGLRGSNAQSMPYSMASTPGHLNSWDSGTLTAHEDMSRDIIDIRSSKVT